jgi:hypothetical protein
VSESSASAPVGVALAVDPDRFAEIVDALRRAGLTVTGEQPVVGTLSGTAPENRIADLQAVDGVEALDRERTVQLPPPDSPAQ